MERRRASGVQAWICVAKTGCMKHFFLKDLRAHNLVFGTCCCFRFLKDLRAHNLVFGSDVFVVEVNGVRTAIGELLGRRRRRRRCRSGYIISIRARNIEAFFITLRVVKANLHKVVFICQITQVSMRPDVPVAIK